MKSPMQHDFGTAPTANIQRSRFDRSSSWKGTFDAGQLIPIFADPVLPGDTFSGSCKALVRMATPIYPVMDNLFIDIHWFFVSDRILWDNARKFYGERTNYGDSIDFTYPVLDPQVFGPGSLGDFFGMRTGVSIGGINALPFRAYNFIVKEWYRDQDVVDAPSVPTDDGPDSGTLYTVQQRMKRRDYFTSCRPAPQKGDPVLVPLGDKAPVSAAVANQNDLAVTAPTGQDDYYLLESGTTAGDAVQLAASSTGSPFNWLETDLAAATGATPIQIRNAFQIQKMLERDSRSGTRYPEIVLSHFRVRFYDATYRPEFLGHQSAPVNISQVPQTSSTDATTPQGNLSAYGTAVIQKGGFTKSFTEHGWVIGIASTRADLTYQQGINRMWLRSTRYDVFWPSLAHVGEEAVTSKEIYAQGNASDDSVFGYQEKDAAYRYKPGLITGAFRSEAAASLDPWHLAQEFASLPVLNEAFMQEKPPMSRVIAVPSEPHFIMDAYIELSCARPIPMYGVPGLIDHF